MSLSIQTNVASLVAQNNIRVNTAFQSNTIQQLSSGFRINSSADDAAGLAVANKYRGDTEELKQGVLNAQNGVSALQIVDGGLNNISTILDRLRTLATESASATFTGDRSTLNTEYQGLLTEINRQASNVKLNTGGTYNTNLVTYVGGGSNSANAQVSVDLSGATNAVDSTALGIANSSVAGGGTKISGNTVRLDNSAVSFLTGTTQSFTFHANTGTGNQDITVSVAGGSGGLTGSQVISNLNTSLQAYGITAAVADDGTLEFGGTTAFTVSTTAAGTGPISATGTATNSAVNSIASGTFAAFALGGGTSASETFVVQNAGGTFSVSLDDTNADTLANAITTINTSLNGSGVYAVKAANGTDISLQSSNSFSVNETAFTAGAGGGTGSVFGSVGAKAVSAASASASNSATRLPRLTRCRPLSPTSELCRARSARGKTNSLTPSIWLNRRSPTTRRRRQVFATPTWRQKPPTSPRRRCCNRHRWPLWHRLTQHLRLCSRC